mgnify:FL=1
MKGTKHRPYNQLKAELRSRKISNHELGKMLGISVSSVSNKINGKSDFLISEIARIESAYLIPLAVFLLK